MFNIFIQAILSGTSGELGKVDGEGKRRVVYDAASNTRIVYRVVTPGELKKNPSAVTVSSSGTIASSPISGSSVAASPSGRGVVGRGRGRRGRPPRTSFVQMQQRKPSAEESESEEVLDDDSLHVSTMDMSKVNCIAETLLKFLEFR